MLTRRIIPCLDVRGGKIVKGVKFQGLREAGDPAERALEYQRQGADELVVLDVSATTEDRGAALDTVAAVREVLSIPLTVGGGVRTVEHAVALLGAGADKVGVNSAAVEDPSLISRLSERVGAQCVVLAIDAAQRSARTAWEVVTRSGTHRTGMNAVEWAARGGELGAGEVLLTSWDGDGTGQGYDLPLINAVAAAVGVPIIASGGASGPDHMADALRAGADAVLAASIFHDGVFTVGQVKEALAAAGETIRA